PLLVVPIISAIGRKNPRTRLLIALIYVALTVGAATMVYPFLLMISGSFKSGVDRQQWDVVPRFLHDDSMLFRKFVQTKYNDSFPAANSTHKTRYFTFENVEPPAKLHERAVADWREFIGTEGMRQDFRMLGFLFEFGAGPSNVRLLKQHLQARTA